MANEKRLIDANALKARFKLRIDWLSRDAHDEYTTGLFHGAETDVKLIDEIPMGQMLRWVRKQPTIDVVPVVRCKDCKHYDKDALWCNINSPMFSEEHYNWYEDDFCSYGERRTDG